MQRRLKKQLIVTDSVRQHQLTLALSLAIPQRAMTVIITYSY